MTRANRFTPLGAATGAFALAVVPSPHLIHVVSGVLLILIVPGYAVASGVVGREGPPGETIVLAVALSVAVTGLGAFALALAHTLGRIEIVALDGGVAVAGGVAGTWRDCPRSADRRVLDGLTHGGEWLDRVSHVGRPFDGSTALLAVVGAVVALSLLVGAFALDSASARTQQRQTSVALSAVEAGGDLHVAVTAPGDGTFSGSLRLSVGGETRVWSVKAPAGRTWHPPRPVSLPATAEVVTLVLSHGGDVVRTLATTTYSAPKRGGRV